ncbi:MAG: hypothetical protein CMI62_13725 [Parvibaculum sp.]|nr:hypothetical protein [Parvibaculum sp.]|tara:strand:- start:2779 stop:4542 length:1764 start_codon:yes stop_codon:yes gene_type:complete
MSLTPRGMSVQEAYRLYSDKKLTVNRRYQRKLVWSENEKRHLVDSIEKELPIPLFMLAKSKDEPDAYEIIDGMQRFNAIFSFIEHQFVDEAKRCFDLEQFVRAKLARDSGVFEEYPKEVARLTPEECARFLEYQLAVTIDTEGDEERVNEVFGRINSGGRQLSPQEQRQAGLVSDFSEFVRKLAFELRGDSSPDVLLLNEMPEVSFSTPKEKQPYGINASDVFWCKHGIITANNLARSEDEQIISDLGISLLNGAPLNASREVFDEYFDATKGKFAEIHTALAAYGSARLKSEVLATIGAIRSVFEAGEFLSFRNCVNGQPRNPARTTFFATFMSFHELMFKNGMFPDDYEGIRKALTNVQGNMIRSAHYATTEDRERNIAVITGLVQKYFVKKDVAVFGSAQALIVDLENSLRRARYEASRYEFKLGLCTLSEKPERDPDIFTKIGRTACAIANTNPHEDGFIYLGVADKKSAADRVQEMFGIIPIKIGDAFFVGLDQDLEILGANIEQYMKTLISEISKCPISDPLRTQITTTIDHAEYQGRPFVRVRVPGQNELSSFAGAYPVRKNSDTVDMSAGEALAQSKLF